MQQPDCAADTTTARPRLAYQPALDGLRGVAVAGVVAFHLGYLQGGFLGVDLFFTLSGYLITRLLLLERHKTGRIALGAFWRRRAWRLLPAVFIVLGAVTIYAALAARPDQSTVIRESGLASLFYVANWHFILTDDSYWNLFRAPTPFDHLWSLAIEEQFYVLWPLLVVPMLSKRERTARLLGVTAVLVVLTSTVLIFDEPGRAYLSTVSRSSSILLGAALGISIHRSAHQQSRFVDRLVGGRTGDVVGALAVAYVFWAWASIDGANELAFYKGGFLAHAVAVASLLALVTLRSDGFLARALSVPPLRQLGVISYGLYLWHWPVIVILNVERVGYGGFALLVTRLVVTFAATLATYWLIERPARYYWSNHPRAIIGLPIAALVLTASLVLATHQPAQTTVVGPIPTTTLSTAASDETGVGVAPDETATSDETAAPDETAGVERVERIAPDPPAKEPEQPDTSDATNIGANVSERPGGNPLVNTTPQPPPLRKPTEAEPLRVLLVGDSYLFDAQPGIEAALEATGIIEVSAGAIFGFALTWDEAFQTLTDLVSEHDPELAVTMWGRFDEAWLADRDYDARSRSDYGELLDDAFGALGVDGAAVAVVGLAPSLTSGVDRVPVDLRINELFQEAVKRFPQSFYVDPRPIIAPDGEPVRWIESNGPLLVRKPDVSHYCPDGAARFGLALGQLVAVATGTTPAEPADWWAGDWRLEARYDDPPRGCWG